TVVAHTVFEEHHQLHGARARVDFPDLPGVYRRAAILLVLGVRAVAAAGDEPHVTVRVRPGAFTLLNGRGAQVDDLLAHGDIACTGIGIGDFNPVKMEHSAGRLDDRETGIHAQGDQCFEPAARV